MGSATWSHLYGFKKTNLKICCLRLFCFGPFCRINSDLPDYVLQRRLDIMVSVKLPLKSSLRAMHIERPW